jgi:hypothetical protein
MLVPILGLIAATVLGADCNSNGILDDRDLLPTIAIDLPEVIPLCLLKIPSTFPRNGLRRWEGCELEV